MTTTFATDTAAALYAILVEQQTATPDLLRKVHPSRPGTYNELPCAQVDDAPETLTYDSGNRTRLLTPTVTLVDAFADNAQTALRLNQLRDLLVDRFTSEIQRIPNTILQLVSVQPVEIESIDPKGQAIYRRGLVLNFANSIREGRV